MIRHPIQDIAGDHRLGILCLRMPGTKAWANDRLVPKKRVLHAGLLMVPRFILPLATPDLFDPQDRAITSTRPRSLLTRSRPS
jgi:hypothetical protein